MVFQNVSRMSFPIRQEILNVSQIGYSIPWNLPTIFHPDLIATILPEVPSFTLAHCPLSNPIRFSSVWCRRTIIPGKIFKGLTKFQGIVSVRDFRLRIRLQELFASSFVFPEKFLFCTDTTESIGWPSPGPRLHIDDCFEIHNLHWELLWSAVIKSPKFSARGTAQPMRLLHGGPCDFCPLADLAISVFREVSIKHCVYLNPHFSQA